MENSTILMYLRYLVSDGYHKLEKLLTLLDPRMFKNHNVQLQHSGDSIGGGGGGGGGLSLAGQPPTQTLTLEVNSSTLEIGTMALLVASLLRLFARGNATAVNNINNNNNNAASTPSLRSSAVLELATDNQAAIDSMQFAKENLPLLKECFLDLLPALLFSKNQNKELESLMHRLYHHVRNFDTRKVSSTGSHIGSIPQDSGNFSSPDNSPRAWSPKTASRVGISWH